MTTLQAPEGRMHKSAIFLVILAVGCATADDSCSSIEAAERADCGWLGIDKDTCEGRGCCYDDTKQGFKYCFYPKGNKCYGIDPKAREDCGYFGITREECEGDRGCCFDHTVQNVPWCFTGHVETKEKSSGIEARALNAD